MKEIHDQPYLQELQNITFQPIFILGVHRSGTSILYKMLTDTGSFNAVTAYHIVKYDELLYNHHQDVEKKVKEELTASFKTEDSEDRRIDNMKVTADFPEEYGFLLTKQTIQMYLTSKNLSLFKELCKKIQMLEGNDKPLLLKNPYDFPNFLFIKKMFPDAKFVFIHRHPFKTISSARSAMDILTQRKNPYGTQLLFGLNEKVYHPLLLYPLRLIFSRIPEISVIIITRITASWTNYYMKNVKKLPANDYVTITYEEFCMHPQATIETIMNKFSIPARNTFDASKLMKPRGKEVDPSVRKFQPFIYKSLKKYFDLFGYSNQ